jgi:hypothetical protein
MRQLLRNVARNVMVFMASSGDHVTGVAGLTLTITSSKDGAAFATITPTVTDRGNGWYSLALTTGMINTVGDLALHVTGTGADPADVLMQVVDFAPVVRSGTAQGGNANALTLDSGASATANLYKGLLLHLTTGTGAGQVRTVISYDGTTKQATVAWPFSPAPTSSTTFALYAAGSPALNSSLQVTSSNARVTVRSGTAQAGTSNTITLDAAASATSNLYVGDLLNLTGGTGAGQSRTITAYNGTTKVATVDRAWTVTPDATTTFDVLASTDAPFSDIGVLQSATATTAVLATTASPTDGVYVGSLLTIQSGTGTGQTREITAYVGSTNTATVDSAWTVTPDATSSYAVVPQAASASAPSVTAADVWSYASRTLTGGALAVNVTQWAGVAVAAPNVAGVPLVDAGYSAGAAVYAADGNLASATATTLTLAATDSAGAAVPDDGRYAYCALQLVGGTGAGQVVLLTTAVGGSPRRYNVLAGTMPVTPDATTAYVVLGTWQAPAGAGLTAADVWAYATRTLTSAGSADVNVVSVNGTAFAGPNVPCVLAGGVAHGGTPGSSTATLSLARLVLASAADDPTVDVANSGSGVAVYLHSANDVVSIQTAYGRGVYIQASSAEAVYVSGQTGLYVNGSAGPAVFLDANDRDVVQVVAANAGGGGGHALSLTAAGAGKHDVALLGSGDVLGSLTGTVAGLPAVDGSGRVTLAPAGLDAVAVESGLNARQSLSVCTAAAAGVLAGAGTTTVTIAAAGTPGTNRITATVDAQGDRTAVTLNPPP